MQRFSAFEGENMSSDEQDDSEGSSSLVDDRDEESKTAFR